MSQVSITLVRADTNQEFDVELPDDANISELLPALVKELGLPLTGPDGNQVAYELSNKRTGRELKEADSLGSASTKTGDVLLLTSTFVAGSPIAPPVNDIIAYEQGELDEEETLALFSKLIVSGLAWTLQGHYGRTARDLIEGGLLDREGTILV